MGSSIHDLEGWVSCNACTDGFLEKETFQASHVLPLFSRYHGVVNRRAVSLGTALNVIRSIGVGEDAAGKYYA